MPFSFILPIFYVLKPLDVRLWDHRRTTGGGKGGSSPP